MNKLLIFILLSISIIAAQNPVILVMKTSAKQGLESESNALPEIVGSKLSRFQSYRIITWDEMEERIGKEKMVEINRCQDSSCIIKFAGLLKQNRLIPNYMLFCSIAKYSSDYTVTLKIADVSNGTVFGMVSTTISNLEQFHSSGIIENIVRKIPAYASKKSSANENVLSIPGLKALGMDESYFFTLTRNISELKSYINFFNYHHDRKSILINSAQTIDTPCFPTVCVYKPAIGDTTAQNASIAIKFNDSISKNLPLAPFFTLFFKGKDNLINKIILKTAVPSQSRYGNDYGDLKKRIIDIIEESDFVFNRADSSTGLYGVNYRYFYDLPLKTSPVKISFIAESESFTVTIIKE